MKQMINNILIYILIFSFVNYIGCYSAAVIDKYDLNSDNGEESMDKLTIVSYSHDRIIIGTPVYQIISDTLNVAGINKSNVEIYNQPVDTLIAMKDIQHIEIDKIDIFKTAGCIGALAFSLAMSIWFATLDWPDRWWPDNIDEWN